MGNILIIEDDPDVLNEYARALSSNGHGILKSLDGSDALFKINKQKFDLIITDLKMPRVNGNNLVDQILEVQLNKECPIIISSGYISDILIQKFSNNKRINFLPKPVTPITLIDTVKLILEKVNNKTIIDVRFVNPILEAAIQIFDEQALKVKKKGAPYIKKVLEPSGDLSALVGMVGAGFKGSISLSFDEPSYLKILYKAFKVHASVIEFENSDGIVELLKTIFERAKIILDRKNLHVELTSPSIVNGKMHKINHSSELPVVVLIFEFDRLYNFRIEICSHG